MLKKEGKRTRRLDSHSLVSHISKVYIKISVYSECKLRTVRFTFSRVHDSCLTPYIRFSSSAQYIFSTL